MFLFFFYFMGGEDGGEGVLRKSMQTKLINFRYFLFLFYYYYFFFPTSMLVSELRERNKS